MEKCYGRGVNGDCKWGRWKREKDHRRKKVEEKKGVK